MNLVVLDASVAAKWLVWSQEPLEMEALHLLERRTQGQLEFLIPDHFWAEVGNILWKAARHGRCSEAQAEHSILALRNYGLTTVPSEQLIERAFAIARKYDRSFYDSLYVALAVSYHATLVTADEKLANATAAHLPVKWLGAFA